METPPPIPTSTAMSVPASRVVRAAGVLLMTATPRPEFLLMRHSDRWDLPKGHCDGEESFLQTAIRELREETSIDDSQIRIDPEFRHELRYPVSYPDRPGETFDKHVVYFLAYVSSKPDVAVSEHAGYRWWPWNPPHRIQAQTIDGLLASVHSHLDRGGR